jgi:hypothetical protein
VLGVADLVDALRLPASCRVDQRVPKKMLAEHGAPTAADRRLLTDGIEELQWIAALKPGTVAIPEHRADGREYLEVAVLNVLVRATHGKASQWLRLAELVHRAVPYPVLLIQALTPDAAAASEASTPEAQSANLVAGNLAQLKAMFPAAFTEGRQSSTSRCSNSCWALVTVDEREEKYGLNWHGKRRARQLALTPSTGTLRPCPEESVDWDTTQNLMIEGDNLEVLKLLQKSYAGKVKLIYIDPPYNTGKDFVYPDNFQDSIKNYLELTGQVEGGRRSVRTPRHRGGFTQTG